VPAQAKSSAAHLRKEELFFHAIVIGKGRFLIVLLTTLAHICGHLNGHHLRFDCKTLFEMM
jgi:hypothetical protein